jgi:hypothetical protein
MNFEEKTENKKRSEEEEEEVEEESFVLLEFTDLDDANYCQEFNSNFKTLQISSKSPIIQIGNRFYSGQYTNSIGTYLFFDEKKLSPAFPSSQSSEQHNKESTPSESANQTSSAANSNQNFAYFGKSFKKLLLTRLFLEKNDLEVSVPFCSFIGN